MTDLKSKKETKKLEKQRKARLKRLEDDLKELSNALSITDSGFNEVSRPELINALIFDRAALEARRSLVLKEMRELMGEVY